MVLKILGNQMDSFVVQKEPEGTIGILGDLVMIHKDFMGSSGVQMCSHRS